MGFYIYPKSSENPETQIFSLKSLLTTNSRQTIINSIGQDHTGATAKL